MDKGKINNFTDLIAWQEGHKAVLMIYKMTSVFPKSEIFGLVSQMRRSAVSITSNIAEGFTRNGPKEKIQFYYISKASITELQNQLIISRDVGHTKKSEFDTINEQLCIVSRLVHGLIKSLR